MTGLCPIHKTPLRTQVAIHDSELTIIEGICDRCLNEQSAHKAGRGERKFPLGQMVITANANARLPELDVLIGLERHASGDWGELDEHDRQENELSLREGFRLLSAYHASNGEKFWIITEADRSVTTVLLPEDY